MAQSRRARRAARRQSLRDARNVGFAAAVGLEVAVDAPDHADHGVNCRHCGAVGRIDLVDTTAGRAFLTCDACGRSWDTARLERVRHDDQSLVARHA